MEFQWSSFKSWNMMLWKCCTQYARKYGKPSSGHRTGQGQFSIQAQRKQCQRMLKLLHNCAHLTRNGNPLHVLAWRIPGTGEPGGLPSMGSHRVGHDWSDLAAAAAIMHAYMRAKLLQSCLTLCKPMDCIPPDSCAHGILQARILVWVAMPSSRGSSWTRDQTHISGISCFGRWVLYHLCHLGGP